MVPQHDPVRVFEVGPRDGLQNESAILPVTQRVEMIKRLVKAGARDIEIGSFVHPRWVPQMASSDEVFASLTQIKGVNYWALVPNQRGLERALDVGAQHVAFFISASETHNKKNLNSGVAETLKELEAMCAVASREGLVTRAYISMVFGCPYEGAVEFDRVMEIATRLREIGVAMISLGDTIGVGTPLQVREECARALKAFGPEAIALHLHDTRGLGVTNALVAYEAGMRCFDSSVGGIGGCPFAPGAAGNLGTEDLLYLLESLGAETGIDAAAISEIAGWLELEASIAIPSRCTHYLRSQRRDL